MLRSPLVIAALAIALPAAASAATAVAPANLSAQDQTFLGVAFRTDDDEVSEGTIAAKNGSTATVRSLGNEFAKAHARDAIALEAVAKKVGFIPPAGVGTGGKVASESLRDVKGVTFDTLYLREQQHGHQKAIAAYKLEAAHGSNPAVVAYAKATLPTIERHLTQIDAALAHAKT